MTKYVGFYYDIILFLLWPVCCIYKSVDLYCSSYIIRSKKKKTDNYVEKGTVAMCRYDYFKVHSKSINFFFYYIENTSIGTTNY